MTIQAEMSERALELLALPDDTCAYVLDIGCGSGIYNHNNNNSIYSVPLSTPSLGDSTDNILPSIDKLGYAHCRM